MVVQFAIAAMVTALGGAWDASVLRAPSPGAVTSTPAVSVSPLPSGRVQTEQLREKSHLGLDVESRPLVQGDPYLILCVRMGIRSSSAPVASECVVWGGYRTAPPTGPATLGFTGHVYGPNAGLIYGKARWYAPELGGWMSEDPVDVTLQRLMSPTGLNAWGYANANPLRYTDPDGRDIFEAITSLFATGPDPARLNLVNANDVASLPDNVGTAVEAAKNKLIIAALTSKDYGQNLAASQSQTKAHPDPIIATINDGLISSTPGAATAVLFLLADTLPSRTPVGAVYVEEGVIGGGSGSTAGSADSTALAPGVRIVLKLDRKRFTADQVAEIENKYRQANIMLAARRYRATVGNGVKYDKWLSRKFVQKAWTPSTPLQSVRIPDGLHVDEFVSRQFGGPQEFFNQHMMTEDANSFLGQAEYNATKNLPNGTSIEGFIVKWQ